MSSADKVEYYANLEDKACLVEQNFCGTFREFATCEASFESIIDFMYTSNERECVTLFEGAANITERCDGSLADLYEFYCPTLSFIEQNLIPIAAGVPAGALLIIIALVCACRTKSDHISDGELLADLEGKPLEQGSPLQSGSEKQLHPELASVIAKNSRYKGLTFDVKTKLWIVNKTGETFAEEKQAAEAAYFAMAQAKKGSPLFLRKQGSSQSNTLNSSFSNSNMPISAYASSEDMLETVRVEPEEEKKDRRMKQLTQFYEYWDSDRHDIPGHVENLFNRHDFTYIARAVRTKFGLLPPGWEEEMEG